MKLFDKVPENFFSPLARKSKGVYALALSVLYDLVNQYRSDLKKSDYVNSLKNNADELFDLFNPKLDSVEGGSDISLSDGDDYENLSTKVNYIIRELQRCGWFFVEREGKNNIEKIIIPLYTFPMLQFIHDMTSTTTTYQPLVHATYSELKIEDEKEDDQMFQTLLNAEQNVNKLSMSVVKIKHAIKSFVAQLNDVTDPNTALKQHFDAFKVEIGDPIYHPMKTYDSFGLYTQPIINILNKWKRDERIMDKLVGQARYNPDYETMEKPEIRNYIDHLIQSLIDSFNGFVQDFATIDVDNANYTEAVQKKVNFLSSSDRTIKGKIDAIIVRIASAISQSSSDDLDQLRMIDDITDTIEIHSNVIFDPYSLNMPHERKVFEDTGLSPLDEYADELDGSDMIEFMQKEVSQFSDDAIKRFYLKNFQNKKEVETTDFEYDDITELVLYINGIIKAQFGNYYFDIEKVEDQILYKGFLMPKYRFIRRETLK